MKRKELALAKRTARWQKKFVAALREFPSVLLACKAAKISRTVAYDRKRSDAEFAQLWSDAIGHSIDELEAKAFRLALDGVGERNQAEIGLIQWLLRCHKPDTYRETNRTEVDQRFYGVLLLPEKELRPP